MPVDPDEVQIVPPGPAATPADVDDPRDEGEPGPADDPEAEVGHALDLGEAEGEVSQETVDAVVAALAGFIGSRDGGDEVDRELDCRLIDSCTQGIARLIVPDPARMMGGDKDEWRLVPLPDSARDEVEGLVLDLARAARAALAREVVR